MWIDLGTWPRVASFEHYRGYERPFFSLTGPVDVSAAWATAKERRVPFSTLCWWAVLEAVAPIEAFHHRLRPEGVWRHPRLTMAVTVLAADETVRFCRLPHASDRDAFVSSARAAMAAAAAGPPRVEDQGVADDLMFGTVVPWVSFTAITHARRDDPLDSVPRLAFGRVEVRDGRATIPFSVEAHHALVDGLHVGRLFEGVEARLATGA
jgi:chloramphenicol O-acetyltransferase type A